jgi:hypothetical protein
MIHSAGGGAAKLAGNVAQSRPSDLSTCSRDDQPGQTIRVSMSGLHKITMAGLTLRRRR